MLLAARWLGLQVALTRGEMMPRPLDRWGLCWTCLASRMGACGY